MRTRHNTYNERDGQEQPCYGILSLTPPGLFQEHTANYQASTTAARALSSYPSEELALYIDAVATAMMLQQQHQQTAMNMHVDDGLDAIFCNSVGGDGCVNLSPIIPREFSAESTSEFVGEFVFSSSPSSLMLENGGFSELINVGHFSRSTIISWFCAAAAADIDEMIVDDLTVLDNAPESPKAVVSLTPACLLDYPTDSLVGQRPVTAQTQLQGSAFLFQGVCNSGHSNNDWLSLFAFPLTTVSQQNLEQQQHQLSDNCFIPPSFARSTPQPSASPVSSPFCFDMRRDSAVAVVPSSLMPPLSMICRSIAATSSCSTSIEDTNNSSLSPSINVIKRRYLRKSTETLTTATTSARTVPVSMPLRTRNYREKSVSPLKHVVSLLEDHGEYSDAATEVDDSELASKLKNAGTSEMAVIGGGGGQIKMRNKTTKTVRQGDTNDDNNDDNDVDNGTEYGNDSDTTEVDFTITAATAGKTMILGTLVGKYRRNAAVVKMFNCPFEGCSKRFPRAYNLRSHLFCHTGERPHKCKRCSSAFARRHDLRRHERTIHALVS
ncbi:hypothetical protein HK100_004006 [Physocladia obscura]|uniref:C2H2-type domain-containing protein n=1 Tax=Physocladia obscura TaxID=109957 RepID=A0AAD5XFU5_9FUNG|nr:hypothetical protein HK100_004006 [Physocladia obscura]